MKKATATIIVMLFLASMLNIALAASVTKFSACKNQFSISAGPTEHVVINEFDQNPPGWDYEGIEWVELFNPAENDVDISGWKLFTTHEETVTVIIPEGTKIAAEEFWVYTHETQWLDDEDESIILYDADGNEIDRTRTTADRFLGDKRCWARYPNGNDTDSDTDWKFVEKWESTKGYSNTITVVESGDKEDLKVGEKRMFRTFFEVEYLAAVYDYKVIECPEFISYSGSFTKVFPAWGGGPGTDYITSIVHVLPFAKLGIYDLRVKWAWSPSPFPPEEWKYVYELHLKVNIVAPTSKFDAGVSLSVEEEVVSPGASVGLEGKASVYDREGKIYPPPSIDLTLVYEKPDGTTFNQSITTGKEGGFSYYGVYDIGVWKVKARWEGDSARHEAESPWVSFKVADTTPPVAHSGPDQTVDEDTSVTFDGSGSSDNIGITSYTWNFMDVTPQTLTSVNPTYSFATPGRYTITLEVTDAAGNSATDTVVITVLDVTNSVADAGPDQTVKAGETVSFDAEGSTDNVGIVSYEWEFGDGTTGTGITTTHIYTEPGTYTVTLTVRDAAGNSDTHSITITVEAPPVEAFPLWIVGVAVATIAIATAATAVFWRRRKQPATKG